MENSRPIGSEGKTIFPEFYNIKATAVYLGIKKSTIYSLVEHKKIPHFRVGRLILFNKSQLDQWMEKNQVACSSQTETANKPSKVYRRPGPHRDIGKIIAHNSIEEVLRNQYNDKYGKPDQVRGLGKEVQDGSV